MKDWAISRINECFPALPISLVSFSDASAFCVRFFMPAQDKDKSA